VHQEKGAVTADDAALIRSYVKERTAQRSLSPGRQNKLINVLFSWRRFLPEYRTLIMDQVYGGLNQLSTGNAKDEQLNLSKNYIYDHVTILKPFLIWLIDEGHNTSLIEKKVLQIKRPQAVIMTKSVSDLLTEPEIRQMLTACKTSRDRALISVLYEGGLRIGEIGQLTWEKITFDEHGLIINLDFKTGKPRFIRCVFATPYLKEWQKDCKGSKNSFVFITNRNEPPTYEMLYRQIRRLAIRAGLKEKHVHPHIFRHSRITHLLQQGMNESAVKMMMWGSINSDMFQSYAHLTGADVDKAVLELHGIMQKKTKDRDHSLDARECPRCRAIAAPTQKFCGICAEPLTEDARTTIQSKSMEITAALSPEEKKAALSSMSKDELMVLLQEIAASKELFFDFFLKAHFFYNTLSGICLFRTSPYLIEIGHSLRRRRGILVFLYSILSGMHVVYKHRNNIIDGHEGILRNAPRILYRKEIQLEFLIFAFVYYPFRFVHFRYGHI
jgi:site-specific recombinase XerD